MKVVGIAILFVALMLLQSLVVTEAYTSPGTQIQMNSNHPVAWVVATPEYVHEDTVIPSWFRRVFIG